MNYTRHVIIIFISAFINLNVLAAPTHVTEFDISGQEPVATGITFNSNGTKMFIVGIDNANGEEINEYSLSVAYDLASTVIHLEAFDISGSTGVPQDVAFNANGTEVFVVSAGGDIFSWTLATAYDVSNPTANHDINLGGNLRGLKFNTDGSKMFVYNAVTDSVVEYTGIWKNGKLQEINKECHLVQIVLRCISLKVGSVVPQILLPNII